MTRNITHVPTTARRNQTLGSAVPERTLRINQEKGKTLAATSAMEEEEKTAKLGTLPDGTKLVQAPKRAWRPQAKNTYEEPEAETKETESLEWAHQDMGKTVLKPKETLSP